MNIVSFDFRSVDDIPFSQPIIDKPKIIHSKSTGRKLQDTCYSRNTEKVRQYYLDNIDKIKQYNRQYYMIHKEELAWGCRIYYANNKKYFEEYRKRNYEKHKAYYRAYSFLKR